MLVTYRLAAETGSHAQILVTLATGIFILPFFSFLATAGQIADKFDRDTITRLIKLFEIGIMLITIIEFYTHATTMWLESIPLLGTGKIDYQSAKTLAKDQIEQQVA